MSSADTTYESRASCAPDLPSRGGSSSGERILPLDKFTESIFINIHEFMNDTAALKVIQKNFSPDVLIQINKSPLNLDGFVSFVSGSRDEISFLDVETRNTIVVPSDEEGRAGTVSLSATITVKRKSDGFISLVQANQIFEITWFQFDNGPGKRLITKVFGVILSPFAVPL